MNAWNKDRQKEEARLVDEREWQAQEQALRDERLGIAASGSDAPDAHYRTIARALSEPPADRLPRDFAHDVARLAMSQAAPVSADARFELTLLNLLGIVLIASGAIVLAMYGREAFAGVDARIVQWGSALAACAALSWSFDWARRRFGDRKSVV